VSVYVGNSKNLKDIKGGGRFIMGEVPLHTPNAKRRTARRFSDDAVVQGHLAHKNPQDHHGSLHRGSLWGPTGFVFLMSEVPLQARNGAQVLGRRRGPALPHMRISHPVGPYSRTMHMLLWWC